VRKIPIPFSRRVDDFRRRALPLAVWLVALYGVVALFEMRGARTEFRGLAEIRDYTVSAPADGVVAELAVEAYQEVAAGQVVALLDPSLLVARLATAAAEVERLGAEREAVIDELAARVGELEREWETDVRRFRMDAAEQRVELLQARVRLETDRVELERRRVATLRAASLVESAVLSEAEAEDLRLAEAVVAERIASTERLVAQLEEEYAAALERARLFAATAPEIVPVAPRLAALEAAVQVQELRLAEIEVQRAALVLRAPASGRVRAVQASAGLAVTLGQPLLSLTPAVGEAVSFWLPPGALETVAPGDRVLVVRADGREQAEGVVGALSPVVGELPPALWRDPATPEYGRAVRLEPQPGLGLVPGEPVRVALQP
jgi:multidrug resistance efflux pump